MNYDLSTLIYDDETDSWSVSDWSCYDDCDYDYEYDDTDTVDEQNDIDEIPW